MNKQEFISTLRKKLDKFPKQEVEERISFYVEIIDDSIEEGITEEQAVSKIGSVDEIVEQIATEIPLVRIVKEQVKPKRSLKAWEIVLLIVGAPLWVSLLAGFIVVLFSAYASLWAGVVSLWGVAIGFCVGGPLAVLLGIIFIFIKGVAEGIAIVGVGLTLAGTGILLFFISKLITKLLIKLTKLTTIATKKTFISRGNDDESKN